MFDSGNPFSDNPAPKAIGINELTSKINSDILIKFDKYEKALALISKIGNNYSGFGISCAKIADNALTNEPLSDQTKKTIQLIQNK